MTRTLQICKAASLVALCAFMVVLTYEAHRLTGGILKSLSSIDGMTRSAKKTLLNIDGAVTAGRDYFEAQKEFLSSERNIASIQAGLDLAAAARSAVRRINLEVIPAVLEVLVGLQSGSVALAAFIGSTDRSVNGEQGFMPQATRLVSVLGNGIVHLDGTIADLAKKGNTSLDDVDRVLGEIEDLAKTMNAIAGHADEATVHIRDSAAYAPYIMASVDKYARTSSKYQKYLLIGGLIATIARASIP